MSFASSWLTPNALDTAETASPANGPPSAVAIVGATCSNQFIVTPLAVGLLFLFAMHQLIGTPLGKDVNQDNQLGR
jgi:hypothetical protein